jgi:hypothetical protein
MMDELIERIRLGYWYRSREDAHKLFVEGEGNSEEDFFFAYTAARMREESLHDEIVDKERPLTDPVQT